MTRILFLTSSVLFSVSLAAETVCYEDQFGRPDCFEVDAWEEHEGLLISCVKSEVRDVSNVDAHCSFWPDSFGNTDGGCDVSAQIVASRMTLNMSCDIGYYFYSDYHDYYDNCEGLVERLSCRLKPQ